MDKLVKALSCCNESRPPVWLMRQAGRYSPSYQKLRTRYSLNELFHNSELIEEITLQPLVELGVDAAIIFSDILIALDAFDHPYTFNEGPQVAKVTAPLVLKETTFPFLAKAIQNLKKRLAVPLLGFAGAPYTLSTYLERQDMIEPLTEAVIALLKVQIANGVDAVQLFDSWANQLSDDAFDSYVLAPLKRIVAAVDTPLIYFSKDLGKRAEKVLSVGVKALSVDHSIRTLRNQLGPQVALQGDLDPDLLLDDDRCLETAVKELMLSMQKDPGFIVNLGHGIKPGSSFVRVKELVSLAQAEGERLWS